MATEQNESSETTPKPEEAEEAAELLQMLEKYNELFNEMAQTRHDVGATKYGEFTFLENDVARMLMEELVDASNYCRYLFMKIGILNDYLAGELAEKLPNGEGGVTIGTESFKGTKEGWKK